MHMARSCASHTMGAIVIRAASEAHQDNLIIWGDRRHLRDVEILHDHRLKFM